LEKTNAKVIATCRSPDKAEELHQLIPTYKDRLIICRLDISEQSSFQELFSDFQKLGIQTIDILIGNAGISNKDHPKDPVLKCDPDEMMKIFQTNVCGNLRLLQTFTPMLLNGSLKLVLLMSSNQGSYDYAVHTHESDPVGYRVSKTALNMLSVVYAIDPEVKQAGVKVLIMHPGKYLQFSSSIFLFFFLLVICLLGWVKTDMGTAKGQEADIDIETSTSGILQVIERVAVLQLHDQIQKHLPDLDTQFQFSAPLEKIEERSDHLNVVIHKLQTDNFVYVQYDGQLLPW
jgi:NAD(P)-dependent dehydrogenase (short-subunit alcohol dehydrogenase family)